MTTPNTDTPAIKRALDAVRAARSNASTDTTSSTPETQAPSREERKALRDAERAAKEAAASADRARKAAAKEARRAEKEAEKAARLPPHTKKIERLRAKLPTLETFAETLFRDATTNLSSLQLEALAEHILLHNRVTATLRASSAPVLPVGSSVRITAGPAKHVGRVGTVVASTALHVKVAVEGEKNPVYLYRGQAELVAPTEATIATAV